MYESIEFPRIHNIERLRRLVPDRWEVASSDVQVAALTPRAVACRYPADTPEATAIDAHGALEIAVAVVSSVEADFERFTAANAG